MTPEQEQSLASIRDTIPKMWFALYQGSVEAGFDEKQAFNLLQTHILGQNPHGSKPGDAFGPKDNKEE